MYMYMYINQATPSPGPTRGGGATLPGPPRTQPSKEAHRAPYNDEGTVETCGNGRRALWAK